MVWKCAKSDLRGPKTQKRPPYRVRCHVQSLRPPLVQFSKWSPASDRWRHLVPTCSCDCTGSTSWRYDWQRGGHHNHGVGPIYESGCCCKVAQKDLQKMRQGATDLWPADVSSGRMHRYGPILCWQDHVIENNCLYQMNACGQLFLSQAICRQLRIVSYHSSVSTGKVVKKTTARAPTIQVKLV